LRGRAAVEQRIDDGAQRGVELFRRDDFVHQPQFASAGGGDAFAGLEVAGLPGGRRWRAARRARWRPG
jgi:hypothetical protein